MNKKTQNFSQALLAAMDRYGDQLCLQVRKDQQFEPFSYQQVQTLVFRLVLFFQYQGVSEGERIVIITDNFIEWLVSYIASLLVGAQCLAITISQDGPITMYESGRCILSL